MPTYLATGVSEALSALGDPTRREIFERLVDGPLPVMDLARGLTVSRPAVSQHLKVLKAAGLVLDRPEGNRRLYRVDPAGVRGLRDYFDRFWDHALAAFKATAEQEHDRHEPPDPQQGGPP
ncbi:MAG TPA: metalloregulator ArsR/SmtB family transcription factor [Acidimicrobiales bacterium]|nr:metalloregulator ArsR/SmtB family transcription factor [Acidimicrobiales bacterium]